MRKKVREAFLAKLTAAFAKTFRNSYVIDNPPYADWVFVYPRPSAQRFYLSQIVCKEQEDALLVSVGWNAEPVMDELASDTGAAFESEVEKRAAILSLAALAPEVAQPICLDEALAAWYRAQREWYEAMNRGMKSVPMPPPAPARSPPAAVLAAVDPTVDLLLEVHRTIFERFDARLQPR